MLLETLAFGASSKLSPLVLNYESFKGKCIKMEITGLKIVIWGGKSSVLWSQVAFYRSQIAFYSSASRSLGP